MNNTGTFTATNQHSAILSLAPHQEADIVLTQTGSNPFRVDLVRMTAGDYGTQGLQSFTAETAATRWLNNSNEVVRLRLECVTIDSGDSETVDYVLRDTIPAEARELLCSAFVLDNKWTDGIVVSLAEDQTNASAQVRVFGLEVGDRIVGAYLLGNVNGAPGEAADLVFDVRAGTASAQGAAFGTLGELTDAISSTGDDTLIDKVNSQISFDHVVAEHEIIFASVTGNTGSGATAELDAIVLQVVRAA